jgi:hypothetical protein
MDCKNVGIKYMGSHRIHRKLYMYLEKVFCKIPTQEAIPDLEFPTKQMDILWEVIFEQTRG